MNRKRFLTTMAQAGQGLTALSIITSCAQPGIISPRKELANYWLWLRPNLKNSDDDWKRTFAKIKDLGFEAILPQIFSSNKALFQIENYETEEPWLERIIPLAHEAGLEVHAWMWTMPCNNPRILNDHPDWYVVNRMEQSANTHPAYVNYYKFLCPRKEPVRKFVQQRVKALASITALDGIHLDYVRMPDVILAEALQPKYDIVQDKEFPEYDYCYCDTCRSAYRQKTGIDPMDIEDPENDKDWYQFRYDAVVDMVNDYLVPAAKTKDKWISAAVFPNWESVRQQWHKFNLDAFLPMLYHKFYNEDIDWVGEETRKAIDRFDKKKPIYSGLFLPHLEPSELIKAVDSAYDGGASGFCLFAYNDLSPELNKQIKQCITNLKKK